MKNIAAIVICCTFMLFGGSSDLIILNKSPVICENVGTTSSLSWQDIAYMNSILYRAGEAREYVETDKFVCGNAIYSLEYTDLSGRAISLNFGMPFDEKNGGIYIFVLIDDIPYAYPIYDDGYLNSIYYLGENLDNSVTIDFNSEFM